MNDDDEIDYSKTYINWKLETNGKITAKEFEEAKEFKRAKKKDSPLKKAVVPLIVAFIGSLSVIAIAIVDKGEQFVLGLIKGL